MADKMIVKELGLVEYQPIWSAMQSYTTQRDQNSPDQLWLVEHPSVFTQGLNGRAEHILNPNTIPVVQTDRGGQVTYHGPGQLIAYTLFDLRRLNLGVRDMVTSLENSVIDLLKQSNIDSYARKDAPGVYVDNKKIASLGLRVKRGCCYHGISLNVAMDLTPFGYINPCGYANMKVIDLAGLGVDLTMAQIKQRFVSALQTQIQNKGKHD
ncbi:MAG: lipoyl(octanoyl) transferase LipB [Gammaproteobacteria bacterium]|nr:lipoyl(octanoyl) transferase LipB [Gammaproteobacteria bacterium]